MLAGEERSGVADASMNWRNNMFDKDRFKACVDWYHANLDSLLPMYRPAYRSLNTPSYLSGIYSIGFRVLCSAGLR